MSTTDGDAIALSGPPRNMTGLVALDLTRSTIVPISITVGRDTTVYRAVARPFGNGRAQIRLRLPNETPPGVYSGEGTIDGKPRRVTIDVDSVMRIRMQPAQTKVTATASSSVEFSFTVTNDGNVPLDVPKADTIDLDDPIGQDRALGKSLRATIAASEKRVDRFFEELRQTHGGEAQITVRAGAGRIEPGQARELACVLAVPATAQAGHSYLGPWHLGNASHVIVADIMASTRPITVKTKARR